MKKNIMIVGVGGQGTLLASKILGYALMKKGYNVKISEVHGMSQRGGSVVTYVKYDTEKEVNSPVICQGEADFVLSFELLEALRWLSFLKKNGKIITSDQKIDPMTVIAGGMKYPENIKEEILSLGIDLDVVKALDLAINAGSPKAVNVVLIGILAKSLDVDYGIWIESIRNSVDDRFLEMNLRAFELGYNH